MNLGYAILGLVLLGFFYLVFGLGKLIEMPILGIFNRLIPLLDGLLREGSFAHGLAHGLLQGLSGGIGIVLPYLGLLAPFTGTVLGLPPETGVTLIFGILRKELTVIMLVQALGTSEFASVLTTGQMMVFTVFTMFYFPCLATLATLRSVIGLRSTLFVLIFTAAAATLLALLFRLAFRLLT